MSEIDFTLDEARALLPLVLEVEAELIPLRAGLIDGAARRRAGDESANLADLKAGEARLSELLGRLTDAGIEVKGYAPLLVDFPGWRDGRRVLWCWLEGERTIEWFHDAEHGFAGRRPLGPG